MLTILITGANRGLGLEFVRQYAADEQHVIACSRQPQKAEDLRALATQHTNIHIEQLDGLDEKSIHALAKTLKDKPIDLLINNAGIFSGTGLDGHHFLENGEDTSQSFGSLDAINWNRVLQTNTMSPVMVTQALLPNILLSDARKIVALSSQMGSIERMTRSGDIAYRTSKAALNAAMKNVALALRDRKITVACLHPGWVKTDMGGRSANLEPADSVAGLRKVIDSLTPEDSGKFFSYDGQIIPW